MNLSIITVNWNVKDYLEKMIKSIYQYSSGFSFEIIVVDNDSRDDSVEMLHQKFQDKINEQSLKIIANDFNAGFSKANNQGLKIAKGNYVLFMNPDMEITENSFLTLLDFYKKTPNLGLLTCRLLYGDKTTQPNVKNDPDFWSQLLIILKLHHFLPKVRSLQKYFYSDFDYTSKNFVKQIMGAFVFGSREVFEKLPGWDEDYWIWFEDCEMCYQTRKLGYDIIYLPETSVIHYESQSFGQIWGWPKQKRFNTAMTLYFRKRGQNFAVLIFKLLQPISYLLCQIVNLLKIKTKTQSTLQKKV
ncbi:MAG: glycosyltransferase family 2 protein [Patescibacteria group bacterium]